MRNFLERYTCGTPMICSYNGPIQTIALSFEDLIANAEDFSVYPNPASASFTIDLSAFKGAEVKVEMFDVLGKNVRTMTDVRSEQINISREELKNGMYVIKVTSDGKQFSRKISLQ
jgi:hypothetical protein